MAGFLNLPLLAVDFIRPQRMRFDVTGNAVSGGRNGNGQEISYEMSGGGFVTCTYGSCWVQGREEHEYACWLAARLNGSFRFINVPLKTDWQGPFPVFDRYPALFVSDIPHSDGALFSDGAGYSQATVWGQVMEDAALNAGTLRLRIYNPSRPLRHSDWFSIYHSAAKGWRAYRYWEVITRWDDGTETIAGTPSAYQEYTLAINPALRAAVTAGTRVEFARPRFAAKLTPGTSVLDDVEGFWLMRPTLQFDEAF
jgi:hypothetical protein